MKPKPNHLTEPYADQWEDACMADAYPNRPPYQPKVFDVLAQLAGDHVLDVGCGTGDIARPLARRVARLDALDRSAAMIAKGKTLTDGDLPRWVCGRVEEIDDGKLDPPYALVTAGECMHWLDWDRAFPRLRAWAPRLALIFRDHEPTEWFDELREIVPRYSTNTEFIAYDLIEELAARDLFHVEGEERTDMIDFEQPLDAFIDSIHSRNGFSRARMSEGAAEAFDAEAAQISMSKLKTSWPKTFRKLSSGNLMH